MTNGDKIRSYSNEQLAELFETLQTIVYKTMCDNGFIPKTMYNSTLNTVENTRKSWLTWLEKEVDLGGFIRND